MALEVLASWHASPSAPLDNAGTALLAGMMIEGLYRRLRVTYYLYLLGFLLALIAIALILVDSYIASGLATIVAFILVSLAYDNIRDPLILELILREEPRWPRLLVILTLVGGLLAVMGLIAIALVDLVKGFIIFVNGLLIAIHTGLILYEAFRVE